MGSTKDMFELTLTIEGGQHVHTSDMAAALPHTAPSLFLLGMQGNIS